MGLHGVTGVPGCMLQGQGGGAGEEPLRNRNGAGTQSRDVHWDQKHKSYLCAKTQELRHNEKVSESLSVLV